ncbi:hypothetical protein [Roseibium aestuarii]|uniref:Uncharacterized protein n=1 Tax=Roseibium aestuarii TaxID=2600299 RepID=A0ABW4JQQ1_9HYPH|nr:hypothetical protein [Roseibium aestuarii]
MYENTAEMRTSSMELEFVKGHIAATMTLIHAMIDQKVMDRDRLDDFFAGFISQLPHNRDTLGLRLVLDQWRQGLRDGREEQELRETLFEVINGGRHQG